MGKFVDGIRGLEWVRLDTAFPRNPKILALVELKAFRAVTCYVAGLAYSGEHGLDGFIPRSALPFLHAGQREARQLEDVGLWQWTEGGWDVHDWHDYQPTAQEAQDRRDRARAAAEKRWKQHRADKLKMRVVTDG